MDFPHMVCVINWHILHEKKKEKHDTNRNKYRPGNPHEPYALHYATLCYIKKRMLLTFSYMCCVSYRAFYVLMCFYIIAVTGRIKAKHQTCNHVRVHGKSSKCYLSVLGIANKDAIIPVFFMEFMYYRCMK